MPRIGFHRHTVVIVGLMAALIALGFWHRLHGDSLRRQLAIERARFNDLRTEVKSVALWPGEAEEEAARLRAENAALRRRLQQAEFDRRFACELEAQVEYYETKYGKREGIAP